MWLETFLTSWGFVWVLIYWKFCHSLKMFSVCKDYLRKWKVKKRSSGNLLKMQILRSHLLEVLIPRSSIGPRNLHLKPDYPDICYFGNSPTRKLCSLVTGFGVSMAPTLSEWLYRQDKKRRESLEIIYCYHVEKFQLSFCLGRSVATVIRVDWSLILIAGGGLCHQKQYLCP